MPSIGTICEPLKMGTYVNGPCMHHVSA